MGFITEADAGAPIVPASMAVIGGLRLSRLQPGGTDNCSSHDDRDTWNERSSWWFYDNFVASPVNFVGR